MLNKNPQQSRNRNVKSKDNKPAQQQGGLIASNNFSCERSRNFWSSGGMGRDDFRRVLTTPDDFIAEPTIRQQKTDSRLYMPFLSYDNYLLDSINEVITQSPTMGAILSQKIKLVVGSELDLVKKKTRFQKDDMEQPSAEQEQSVSDYLDRMNPEGDSVEMLLYKVATCGENYGNCFLELTESFDAEGNPFLIQRVLAIQHCRPKKNNVTGRAEFIGVSMEFDGLQPEPNCVYDIPLFPKFDYPKDNKGIVASDGYGLHKRSIIHIKDFSTITSYWGLPTWIAGKKAGELEYRIFKYNESQFDNGFMPSAIIQYFGALDKEQGQAIIDNTKAAFTGDGNNSRIVCQVLANPDNKMNVQVLDNKYEGMFLELFDMCQKAAVTASQWDVSLIGLGVAGELGNNQQVKLKLEYIQNMYINSKQRIIENQWLIPMLQKAAQYMGKNWADLMLRILHAVPISFLGNIDLTQILDKNELRKEAGFPPAIEPVNVNPVI